MLGVLRNGQYLRLWLAQVVSQLGDGIVDVVILVLIAKVSHGGLLLGLVVFAQLLPSAVFGAFMGPLVDRWPKKTVMVVSDLYRLVVVLAMIPLQHDAWCLLLLIVLQGIGTAMFSPAKSAVIPQIVGEDRITQATALSQGTWSAMQIIGPALAGICLLLQGPDMIFTVDAVTFLLSAGLLSTLRIHRAEQRGSHPRETYWISLETGVKRVVGMPALRFLLILLIPVTIAAGMLNADFSIVMLKYFHVTAVNFGMLDACMGVGAVLGALCGPFFLNRFRPGPLLLVGTGLMGLSMVGVLGVNALIGAAGVLVVYGWCFVTGYVNTLINVPLGSLFLGITPADFRGRGAALMQSGVNASVLLGILLGGWVAQMTNALIAMVSAGIVMVIAVVLCPLLKGYRHLHQVASGRASMEQKRSGDPEMSTGV